MIAERQKPSVRERIADDFQKIREWVREQIRLKQKPELDEKVRRINVRRIVKKKILSSLRKGAGASFGRRLGGFARRLGLSVARLFGF
jgi:hypothetical protein